MFISEYRLIAQHQASSFKGHLYHAHKAMSTFGSPGALPSTKPTPWVSITYLIFHIVMRPNWQLIGPSEAASRWIMRVSRHLTSPENLTWQQTKQQANVDMLWKTTCLAWRWSEVSIERNVGNWPSHILFAGWTSETDLHSINQG